MPYGLTWLDLVPCLPGLDEEGLDRCRALARYEKQGLSKGTNSCIVTLQYMVAGERCERTVFVKQTADATAWEAAKYHLLSSHGVPTPELLLAISRNQAEVLVLEFLPTIGVDFHSSHQIHALLQLVARLNSVETDADIPVPGYGMPDGDFDARVKAALTKIGLEPPSTVAAERWFQGYQLARDALAAMPRALCHGELYFQQVGWAARNGTHTLVLFDLAMLACRPRFSDIGNILPLLAQESGERELHLLETYLE
ncbi:MAG: phosphotransferase [Chloroflexota bacterium]|nr:phosphotransferase [Chloroflexota bacterium]